ncbi:hypothetical protein N7G274_010259 [Stereocaulon virgatum]|uniref:NADH dehydrogenase [ubiquinone] 1 beta subcomplex subunit 2 n=1 Tax=Stereocaulon virgatum TaxID=373712 RepID=A0ABR3ZTW0_9LECA
MIATRDQQEYHWHLNDNKISSDRMVGKHGGHGSHPIHMHPVRPFYRFAATGLGASMWFWLMWRAKKDGPVLLGWRHKWEH